MFSHGGQLCLTVSLKAFVHYPIHSSTFPYTKNRILKTSVRIWVQFRHYFGLQSFSALAPWVANHVFPPSSVDNAFVKCSNSLSLGSLKTCILTIFLLVFNKIQTNSLKVDNFRFLQVRSFAQSTFPMLKFVLLKFTGYRQLMTGAGRLPQTSCIFSGFAHVSIILVALVPPLSTLK